MARNTKNTVSPSANRETKIPQLHGTDRVPTYAERPALGMPIAWNFKRMDTGGKFKCSLKLLHEYAENLLKLEGKTIQELMDMDHNHPMSASKLSPVAQARITALNLEEETLHQLDLKTPARLWGVLEHNIFHVIWLDTQHKVYQCK